jgi:DnaK suppressor protein
MPAESDPSTFLAAQRAVLAAEVAQRRARAATLRTDATTLVTDRTADTSSEEESGEGDGLAVARDQSLAMAQLEDEAVAEAERALDRMDRGLYETCDDCGGEIGRPRLQALPAASVCVTCKARSPLSRHASPRA